MRRLALLVLLAGLLVATEQTAFGCDCEQIDPRMGLAGADGAFVGRLTRRPDPQAGTARGNVTWTFFVERVLKGNIGVGVEVEAAANGASCGLEVGVGERAGLLMYRQGETWTSGLCFQVDPNALIQAAEPQPRVAGSAPTRFEPARPPWEQPGVPAPAFILAALLPVLALVGWRALRRRV